MMSPRLLPLFLLALVGLAACDQTEETAPFQVEAGTLTLYGFLDATRSVQRARIEPRRQDLDYPRTPEAAFLDDTEVLSFRLGEGEAPDTVRWVQRAERLPDGTYAAIFSASFRPEPLARYRVVTRRAAGDTGPAAESVKDILIPSARPAETGAWYQDGDRVVLPVTWPDHLHARIDTVEALHSGCLSIPDQVLDIPDTVIYTPRPFILGVDTFRVYENPIYTFYQEGSFVAFNRIDPPLDSLIYIPDTLVVGLDTIRVYRNPIVLDGDTVWLDLTDMELLDYTRPVPPQAWARTGPVEVRRLDNTNAVEVDLRALARSFAGISDSHYVRYDRLRVGVRVRNADWTDNGGDPNVPASGFLGGVDAGYTDFYAPSDVPAEAIEKVGLGPGGRGARCS